MSEAEQIAEFLARKGATRVPTGAKTLSMSRRDWHDALRHPGGVSGVEGDKTNALIAARRVVGGVVYNGLGEIVGRA